MYLECIVLEASDRFTKLLNALHSNDSYINYLDKTIQELL